MTDREAVIKLQTASANCGSGGKTVSRLITSIHRKYQAPSSGCPVFVFTFYDLQKDSVRGLVSVQSFYSLVDGGE